MLEFRTEDTIKGDFKTYKDGAITELIVGAGTLYVVRCSDGERIEVEEYDAMADPPQESFFVPNDEANGIHKLTLFLDPNAKDTETEDFYVPGEYELRFTGGATVGGDSIDNHGFREFAIVPYGAVRISHVGDSTAVQTSEPPTAEAIREEIDDNSTELAAIRKASDAMYKYRFNKRAFVADGVTGEYQLIYYDDYGTTPVATFDLLDAEGSAITNLSTQNVVVVTPEA